MYNRRELVTLTLAGLAAPIFNAYVFTRGRDTAVGVQTRSFRDLHRLSGADPIDGVIAALVSCRVHHCELFAPQIEPQFVMSHGHHGMSSMARQMMRRELRKWRLRAPESQFRAIGQRFEMAGIAIAAFDYSPDASFSDEEIDAGFVMAKALGAEILTASAAPDIAARIAPFADRHRMVVALRGDAAAADPNAVGSVASALRLSKWFRLSLDIGDLTAANVDPIAFLRGQYRNVATLRLKDRRRNHGENRPWGQGDTPIRDVLRLVRDENWPIRGFVDYAYEGPAAPVDEVKKCLAYAAEATT